MMDHAHKHKHSEKHFTAQDVVRDLVIGMSDGLTVPFALAAGLAAAAQSTSLVVTAGLAEIAAGSIAMGLGGYLAGKSEVDHYANEKAREEREIVEVPDEEAKEVANIFASYGLEDQECMLIVKAMQKKPEVWRDFMMKFELGLDEPSPYRARRSALTIGGSYIAGGLIPLSPYMVLRSSQQAFYSSVFLTLISLLVFGYFKGRFMGTPAFKSALQTCFIGGTAALVAYFVAILIS